MASLVITVIGDDRAGLVNALSGAIARHGGNWDRSHLTELAGKFAGIVLATVAETNMDDLLVDLERIEAQGLLHITAERADTEQSPAVSHRLSLELVGQDHPGIVHEISDVLARHRVSIEELETETTPAPMGGHLFRARASLEAPTSVDPDDLQRVLEAVAHDLMVDLDFTEED